MITHGDGYGFDEEDPAEQLMVLKFRISTKKARSVGRYDLPDRIRVDPRFDRLQPH